MSIAPSQILYLEHGPYRLYAEAIQIIASRRLCWARPTLLIQGLPEGESAAAERQQVIADAASERRSSVETDTPSTLLPSTLQLYDLENAPDLIWPQELFEIAYDLDFFALLIQLKMRPDEVASLNAHQQLNHFLHSFWKARPQAFPPALSSATQEKPPHVSSERTANNPVSGHTLSIHENTSHESSSEQKLLTGIPETSALETSALETSTSKTCTLRKRLSSVDV